MKELEISIVIPVYNSSSIIEELQKQIAQAMIVSYEIIFVNDCSKDDSWKKIVTLSKQFPNITGIHLRKNSGQDITSSQ